MLVSINYNSNEETMEIVREGENEGDQKIVFFGNYWNFRRDPDWLAWFLKELGVNADTFDVTPEEK